MTQKREFGMGPQARFVVAVYANADIERIRPVVLELEKLGIRVWVEMDDLSPGANFERTIFDVISRASGAIAFVSWRLSEARLAKDQLLALKARGVPIFAVLMDDDDVWKAVPSRLRALLTEHRPVELFAVPARTARQLAEGIVSALAKAQTDPDGWAKQQLDRPQRDSSAEAKALAELDEAMADHLWGMDELAHRVAADLAQAARGRPPGELEAAGPPRSVFIVHGHDDDLLQQVEEHLGSMGVQSVVLRRIGGAAQSLFQRFNQWGRETRFALVLLSADDLGASREQFDTADGGTHALQFRARQNVILELGYFYGHLGWDRVFVLYKQPDRIFPNFERPSDLEGVVYDTIDAEGRWKKGLEDTLRKSGFVVP